MGWNWKIHFVACTGEMFCYRGDGIVVVGGKKWICRPQGFGGLPRRGLRESWKFCLMYKIVCLCTPLYFNTYIIRQHVYRLSSVATKTPAQGCKIPLHSKAQSTLYFGESFK
jgi:hypothetical protein